jgi:hypothetical protein
VRARYPNDATRRNDLGKGAGAANYGDSRLPRRFELGMVVRHGGRMYYGSRPGHMTRVMSLPNLRTKPDGIGRPGRVQVTPGDAEAAAQRDERERAHPSASDTHQVNGSGVPRNEQVHGWAPI